MFKRRELSVHLTSQCDLVPLGALMFRNQVVSNEDKRVLDTGRNKSTPFLPCLGDFGACLEDCIMIY